MPPLSDQSSTIELSEDARLALGHIRCRTRTGRFACRLWNMEPGRWGRALNEIRAAGYRIEWTHGTVADDPTVTGGWVLRNVA